MNPMTDLSQDRAGAIAERGAPPDPNELAGIQAQKQAALQPIEQAMKAEGASLPTPPGQAQLPQTPNQPLVDPNEYSKFSGLLVGMALIAGAKSGNWYGTAHSLNGALRGYLEGSQAKADEAWKKYQADYQKAVEQHKEQQQEYMDVLENKKLSINEKFQQWSMLAAKYDDQQKVFLARQKRYDEMTKAIIGMDEHRETLNLQKIKLDEQIKKAMEANAASSQAVLGEIDSGVPLNIAVPGFGNSAVKQRTKALDDWSAQYVIKHPGTTVMDAGKEYARRQVNYLAERSSVSQLTKMMNATRPAVKQLAYNIGQVDRELTELPGTDLSPVINAIIRQEEQWTGEPALAGLFFNMNGAAMESARLQSGGQASIAQLHQGAADEAQKWANANMTPASWKYVSKQMLAEGEARVQQFQESLQEAEGQTPEAPTGGTAVAPYTDAAKEQRYQEWKRAHQQ